MYDGFGVANKSSFVFKALDSAEIEVSAELDNLFKGFRNSKWVYRLLISIVASQTSFQNICADFKILKGFEKM